MNLMFKLKYYIHFFLILFLINLPIKAFSDNHNIDEIIKLIQKDLKTLERAVYSENFSTNQDSNENVKNMDQNSDIEIQ